MKTVLSKARNLFFYKKIKYFSYFFLLFSVFCNEPKILVKIKGKLKRKFGLDL